MEENKEDINKSFFIQFSKIIFLFNKLNLNWNDLQQANLQILRD